MWNILVILAQLQQKCSNLENAKHAPNHVAFSVQLHRIVVYLDYLQYALTCFVKIVDDV